MVEYALFMGARAHRLGGLIFLDLLLRSILETHRIAQARPQLNIDTRDAPTMVISKDSFRVKLTETCPS